MALAARVIADSERTKRDLIKLFPRLAERVSVVPCGLSDMFHPVEPRWRQGAKERLAVPMGCHVILHVGGSKGYKNVAAILRSVKGLNRDGDTTCLIIAGELDARHWALIQNLGIARLVRVEGRVTDERLIELYHGVDVLAFPSWYEGFGWPPLEAMACGVPVVCSDAGSLPEVVGDAALTVPPGDDCGLTEALRKVLRDSVFRNDLVRRGFQRAARFSWDKAASEVLAIYERVADGRASA
jgi:glycosyltransferase involved in cell wall biosynthesis